MFDISAFELHVYICTFLSSISWIELSGGCHLCRILSEQLSKKRKRKKKSRYFLNLNELTAFVNASGGKRSDHKTLQPGIE